MRQSQGIGQFPMSEHGLVQAWQVINLIKSEYSWYQFMSHGGHSDEEKKANFLAKKMRLKPRHRYPTSSCELCFFLLFTSYIFSSCLRVAYALPTPLRCFPTRGLFVLICLRVPTLTSCFLILPTRLACVASVGFLLVLILHILPTRWAQMIESTSNILWKHKTYTNQNATSNITTKHFLQHRLRRKKKLPTSSKCIRKAYARKRNAYASTSQDILCINWIFLLKNAAHV